MIRVDVATWNLTHARTTRGPDPLVALGGIAGLAMRCCARYRRLQRASSGRLLELKWGFGLTQSCPTRSDWLGGYQTGYRQHGHRKNINDVSKLV